MNRKILIVTSTYYKDISSGLISGSKYILEKKNIDFEIIYVPGTFEISLAIKHYIDQYDGFVALGCVIRGETYHFELIANECARGIHNIIIENKKPVGFGIITCNNIKEAESRSKFIENSDNSNNKGLEATKACIEMLNILKA